MLRRSAAPRRWAAGSALLVGLLLVAWYAGYRTYVVPHADPAPSAGQPADAIVALGGMPEVGTFAADLVAAGRGRELVLSDPYTPRGQPNDVTRMCAGSRTDLAGRITCFAPDPATTRGEAEEIARLAAQRHWRTVVVVAPTFHVSRARLIVSRCFADDLRLVEYPVHLPPWWWAYQFAYQTAGYAKTVVLRSC